MRNVVWFILCACLGPIFDVPKLRYCLFHIWLVYLATRRAEASIDTCTRKVHYLMLPIPKRAVPVMKRARWQVTSWNRAVPVMKWARWQGPILVQGVHAACSQMGTAQLTSCCLFLNGQFLYWNGQDGKCPYGYSQGVHAACSWIHTAQPSMGMAQPIAKSHTCKLHLPEYMKDINLIQPYITLPCHGLHIWNCLMAGRLTNSPHFETQAFVGVACSLAVACDISLSLPTYHQLALHCLPLSDYFQFLPICKSIWKTVQCNIIPMSSYTPKPVVDIPVLQQSGFQCNPCHAMTHVNLYNYSSQCPGIYLSPINIEQPLQPHTLCCLLRPGVSVSWPSSLPSLSSHAPSSASLYTVESHFCWETLPCSVLFPAACLFVPEKKSRKIGQDGECTYPSCSWFPHCHPTAAVQSYYHHSHPSPPTVFPQPVPRLLGWMYSGLLYQ